jgi:Pyruvate/2-oxoacid:ferredoxin oxidoreductase gamma subunit
LARTEIRIAGFGGQGVITAGYILANSASIHDDPVLRPRGEGRRMQV